MGTIKFLLVFVILTVVTHRGLSATWNCQRKGQSCAAIEGVSCGADGACVCPETHTNYDCGVVIANVNASMCDPPCQNEGFCEDDGAGVFGCKCTESNSGNVCEINRVDIVCFGLRKVICVDPVGFAGTAFITGKRNMTDCIFTPTAGGTDENVMAKCPTGLRLDVTDISEPCGNATETVDGDTRIMERSVNIEYDSNIITSLDEILTAKCNMTSLAALDPTLITPQYTQEIYKNTSTENTYQPIQFTSTNADGTPVGDTPILIGTEISFSLQITADTGFSSIIIESLKATDTLDPPTEMVIIDAKCPTEDSPSVMTSLTRDATNMTIELKMKVFKFVTSDQISFTMTNRICKTNDTLCDELVDCTTVGFQGLGRRKRQSGDETTLTKTVHVTDDVSLTKPAPITATNTENCQDSNAAAREEAEVSCLQSTEIVIVMAMLSFVIILLFIVCLILIRKLLNTGPKVVDVYPSDSHSTTSLHRPHF